MIFRKRKNKRKTENCGISLINTTHKPLWMTQPCQCSLGQIKRCSIFKIYSSLTIKFAYGMNHICMYTAVVSFSLHFIRNFTKWSEKTCTNDTTFLYFVTYKCAITLHLVLLGRQENTDSIWMLFHHYPEGFFYNALTSAWVVDVHLYVLCCTMMSLMSLCE